MRNTEYGIAGIKVVVTFRVSGQKCYRLFKSVELAKKFVEIIDATCSIEVIDANGYVVKGAR